jgi:hypothetical protein
MFKNISNNLEIIIYERVFSNYKHLAKFLISHIIFKTKNNFLQKISIRTIGKTQKTLKN